MRGSPDILRRFASITFACAIQGAFFFGFMSATGVNAPSHIEPLIIVPIPEEHVEEKLVTPPPPRFIQPVMTITLPVIPAMEVETFQPPPAQSTVVNLEPARTYTTEQGTAPESYESVMLRYLNAHLRYPRVARARHQHGIVYVRFVMNRSGSVLSVTLDRSSQFAALDEEGLALLTRAQPLPAPPANIPGDTLQLVIPISFVLN